MIKASFKLPTKNVLEITKMALSTRKKSTDDYLRKTYKLRIIRHVTINSDDNQLKILKIKLQKSNSHTCVCIIWHK